MINARKTAALIIIPVIAVASLVFAFAFASYLQLSFHGVGVLKSADSFTYVGDSVTYHIKVYNPSNYDLHNVNVTDAMLGLNDTIPFIKASNTTGVTYSFEREVLETDPNPLVNTVSVEAIDSEGVYSTASTQAITTIAERLVDISKVGPESAYRGEEIKYTITINNTGDSDLFDVIAEDEMLGFSWKGNLNAGETNVFNLTYRVPCKAEETLTNTATVRAQLNETTIYSEASWTTKILHPYVTRSMGYWKNHPEAWPVEKLEVGNITYTKEQALEILKEANAKDATRMLAAQLIAAKLNRLTGSPSSFSYCDEPMNIDEIISETDNFLTEHPIGSDPQGETRIAALHLKDMLDEYNNMEWG